MSSEHITTSIPLFANRIAVSFPITLPLSVTISSFKMIAAMVIMHLTILHNIDRFNIYKKAIILTMTINLMMIIYAF